MNPLWNDNVHSTEHMLKRDLAFEKALLKTDMEILQMYEKLCDLRMQLDDLRNCKRAKRGPSAYNIFIGAKLKELREKPQ